MLVPSPKWLDTGNNAWQLAAATFVGLQSIPGPDGSLWRHRQEEMGDQFRIHVAVRLRLGAGRLDPVRLQHGVRAAMVSVPRQARCWRPRPRSPLGQATIPAAASGMPATDLPDGDAGVLPVRVRRDHRDHPCRLGARAHEFQGLGDLLPGVDDTGLYGRGVQPVGWRLACRHGRGGLLGRLCHPSCRRHLRLRRRGDGRSTPAGRIATISRPTAC